MKTIIIILLLIVNISATNWYVDDDISGGSANGTSWANAWNSLDDINFASLSAGDTVYVSGGSDSTLYITEYTGKNCIVKSGYTFASGNPVVICPSWESNHNGGVYLTRKDTTYQYVFHLRGVSNVKIYGFHFYNILNDPWHYGGIAYLGGGDQDIPGTPEYDEGAWFDSLQTFEQCTFTDSGYGNLVNLVGCRITLKNCWLEHYQNNHSIDGDPCTGSGGRGGHTVIGCTIIQNNGSMTTDAHRDMIQWSGLGIAGENLLLTIANNMVISRNPVGLLHNGASVYSPNATMNNRWLIYNNIFVARNETDPCSGLFIYQNPHTHSLSVRAYNNTIIMKGSQGGTPATVDSGIDTLIMKNNLFISDTTNDHLLDISDVVYNYNMTLDYNCWGMKGGANGMLYVLNGHVGYCTFAEYQADGYDTHGFTMDSDTLNVVSLYDTSRASYYTTLGRDLGVDISSECPECVTDALGNSRIGHWSMGALEYGGSPPEPPASNGGWGTAADGTKMFTFGGKLFITAEEQ